jgi:hypothetical protein
LFSFYEIFIGYCCNGRFGAVGFILLLLGVYTVYWAFYIVLGIIFIAWAVGVDLLGVLKYTGICLNA